MNSKEQVKLRLKLAQEYLSGAKEHLKNNMVRDCADNAQLSIENSGKAIISNFEPIEKTHEPAEQIRRLIQQKKIPAEFLEIINDCIPMFEKWGSKKHILISYGDEDTLKTPWELVSIEDAREGIEFAEKCLQAAEKLAKYYE